MCLVTSLSGPEISGSGSFSVEFRFPRRLALGTLTTRDVAFKALLPTAFLGGDEVNDWNDSMLLGTTPSSLGGGVPCSRNVRSCCS